MDSTLLNRDEIRKTLKPCPFCGGRARFEDNHRAFIGGVTTRVSFIRCSLCEARSARIPNKDNGSLEALNEAYRLWNRRSNV